jgi:hypothetical protein
LHGSYDGIVWIASAAQFLADAEGEEETVVGSRTEDEHYEHELRSHRRTHA